MAGKSAAFAANYEFDVVVHEKVQAQDDLRGRTRLNHEFCRQASGSSEIDFCEPQLTRHTAP